MSNSDKSVLDIIGWCQRLEKQIDELKKENEELKTKFTAIESESAWRELIIYRPAKTQTPTEITWTEDDDLEKQKWYRENGFRRDVIGLVRELPNSDK